MYWVIGTISNAVIAVAYLCIMWAILVPLVRSGQVRTNLLGTATATIFLTCAVHHGGHVVHVLLPYLGVGERQGLAMRSAYDWEMAAWDVVGAIVGVYYWTLRRGFHPDEVRGGAKLFEDKRQREDDAVALNDDVLQGLVVAKLALELEDTDRAVVALDRSIAAVSRLVGELLGTTHATQSLRRSAPASLREPT